MKALALHWVEYGFGSPKMIPSIYVLKVLFLYMLAGAALATWTSGTAPFWDVAGWWNQPVVYQKLVLWTVLLEALGVAGSWGPMAGKFKPMTGGVLFWARPDTIRLCPWRRVPFTSGDRRTVVDVVLYLALLATLLAAIVPPGVPSATLSAAVPGNTTGLVNPALLVAPMVLLVLCGLRDKTLFLAARGEQYLPAMVFFAVRPFVDMIIALKLLIVVVWIGAGVSKFGLRFSNVVAPMVSNSPSVPAKWFKRMQYRDFPRDLRPSKVAGTLAQIERFAPGFRDRIVGTQARTTTGFAAYNANYVGGDILTGAKTIAQVVLGPRPTLDPYRIGVPGMFLCSAATPPGPGAHGMCGANAAASALRHLRR